MVINGTFSNWADVGSGVPQGSILGPILFLLFVNDMLNVINSATLAMFADDSKCYRIINNDADFSKLQQDLFSLTTWSLSNELYFQPTKCSHLRISRKRIRPYRSYSLNGIDVEVVSTGKDLGVVIVNDTSWKDHILMIVAKANRLLGFIRRSCEGIVDNVALLRLCCSLVRSHFCYCSQLWAPQSVISNLFLVEEVQRRATRFLLIKNIVVTYLIRIV